MSRARGRAQGALHHWVTKLSLITRQPQPLATRPSSPHARVSCQTEFGILPSLSAAPTPCKNHKPSARRRKYRRAKRKLTSSSSMGSSKNLLIDTSCNRNRTSKGRPVKR